MQSAGTVLPAVWFALLGFILLLYTMLDGFDLGVGILSLFARGDTMRGLFMGTLGSIWDANETWLVLFGGIIFGAFPTVYGLVMSSLYLPLVLMLVGLIFRAVSFEFRAHAARKEPWSLSFGWGSLAAAASQGFAFGGLLWGIETVNGRFTGTAMSWLTPFSIITAVAVLGGYVMFGSTWLIMKTDGEAAALARRGAIAGAAVAAAGAIADTVLAVSRYPSLSEKWFVFPGVLLTVVPFILGVLSFLIMLVAVVRKRSHLPFICAMAFALFGYVALSVNYFPLIVPPSITVYETAAQPLTLRAMLWAVGIALPILLSYNIFQYWIFRGKTAEGAYEDES